MESFFSAAAVAAAGGIAYVAYKHPNAYKTFMFVVMVVFVPVGAALLAYDIGVTVAWSAALAGLPEQMKASVDSSVRAKSVASWVHWVYSGSLAYLFFLEWITRLIREQDQQHDRQH